MPPFHQHLTSQAHAMAMRLYMSSYYYSIVDPLLPINKSSNQLAGCSLLARMRLSPLPCILE